MNGKVNIVLTSETKEPVIDLIKDLKTQAPLKALTMDDTLRGFACDHVNDQGPTQKLGHSSTGDKNLE